MAFPSISLISIVISHRLRYFLIIHLFSSVRLHGSPGSCKGWSAKKTTFMIKVPFREKCHLSILNVPSFSTIQVTTKFQFCSKKLKVNCLLSWGVIKVVVEQISYENVYWRRHWQFWRTPLPWAHPFNIIWRIFSFIISKWPWLDVDWRLFPGEEWLTSLFSKII